MSEKYDDTLKQVCWQTYWEGYKLGRGVEDYTKITKRTARNRFERLWEQSNG